MWKDPNELRNLFGDKDHHFLVRQLAASLLDYAKEHQDPHARVPAIQNAIADILKR